VQIEWKFGINVKNVINIDLYLTSISIHSIRQLCNSDEKSSSSSSPRKLQGDEQIIQNTGNSSIFITSGAKASYSSLEASC
jgi:hypothetical protein